jgi:hypothetical protein
VLACEPPNVEQADTAFDNANQQDIREDTTVK